MGGGSAREAEGDAVPLLHDTQATPHGTPNNCVESNLMLNALILKKKKKGGGQEEKEKKCLPLEKHLAEVWCEAMWHNIKGPGCEEIKPDS